MQIYTQTPDAAHRGFVLFQYNINFMRLAVVGAFDFSIERHAVKCHFAPSAVLAKPRGFSI